MSEVGDVTSENYDPKFDEWANIGKNLHSQNIGGEQLAPHKALNLVEATRNMYSEYIGNVDGLSKRIALNLSDDSMTKIAAILQMTDEQVKLYNYYLGKEYYNEVKSGTANKYLEYLKTQYNLNTADIIQKELKNKPFFQYAYSAHAGKQKFEDNMESLSDFFKKDTYRAETASEKANAQIRQDVIERDGVMGQIGYDLINTTSYQLPSILASTVSNVFVPGSGPIVGAGLTGISSTSGAYQEAKRAGFDENQARFYALGIGASEAMLSYTIGGISKLGGKVSGNIISKTLDGIDNGIARFALQYGGRILSEGLEEGIQEILDPIFKALASNTSVEYWGGIDWGNVAYSALMGGLSTGVFELSSSITTNYNNNKINPDEVIAGMWEDSPNASKNTNSKNLTDDSISDNIEMYRKGSTHRRLSSNNNFIIDKPTYQKITNPVIKQGADIRIANDEWLQRLKNKNASALTIGDVIFFREDATVSDVLEETYHFLQNKKGLNSQYNNEQRTILNEIDAKEYLLSMTERYHIPEAEVDLTRRQLAYYRKQMKELQERNEWND